MVISYSEAFTRQPTWLRTPETTTVYLIQVHLQYYKEAFNNDGIDILTEYNFTYATCDYCPGEYWPDNKSGERTLLIYGTQQPVSNALDKLGKLVKENVYI